MKQNRVQQKTTCLRGLERPACCRASWSTLVRCACPVFGHNRLGAPPRNVQSLTHQTDGTGLPDVHISTVHHAHVSVDVLVDVLVKRAVRKIKRLVQLRILFDMVKTGR